MRAQLGAQLQACRTLARMSQRALAAALSVAQTTVSRIERGELLPDGEQANAWLSATNAPSDLRRAVRALVKQAHVEQRTWEQIDVTHMQSESRDKNAASRHVQIFDPTVLPGLLQTADYARRVIELADVAGKFDHAAALAGRIERQGVLRQPGRLFQFIIAERLLRWEPIAGVLEPQLAQLAAAARLETVELAVLPEKFADALPWHNFVIREPADGSPPYVDTELVHGPQTIREPGSVAVYQWMWDRLWKASRTDDEALALIRAASDH